MGALRAHVIVNFIDPYLDRTGIAGFHHFQKFSGRSNKPTGTGIGNGTDWTSFKTPPKRSGDKSDCGCGPVDDTKVMPHPQDSSRSDKSYNRARGAFKMRARDKIERATQSIFK